MKRRVSLFVTCLVDQLRPEVARATVAADGRLDHREQDEALRPAEHVADLVAALARLEEDLASTRVLAEQVVDLAEDDERSREPSVVAQLLEPRDREGHLEALSTIRTERATVQVVDIFGLDFGPLLDQPGGPIHGGELDTSLLLYLAPERVRMDLALDFALTPKMLARYRPGHSRRLPEGSPGSVGYPSLASAQKGEVLYKFILDRISSYLAGN